MCNLLIPILKFFFLQFYEIRTSLYKNLIEKMLNTSQLITIKSHKYNFETCIILLLLISLLERYDANI